MVITYKHKGYVDMLCVLYHESCYVCYIIKVFVTY